MIVDGPDSQALSSIPPSNRPSLVLVVDDDEALRDLVVRWLVGAGLSCLQASSGDEALRITRERVEDIDAVVLDVMLPGLDGFQVLAALKADERTALVPVILLTAHATNEGDIVRSVEAGAMDHVEKPFSGPVLVAKVKAATERARAERRLRRKLELAEKTASIDPLTGLFNRRHFELRLDQEMAHVRRHKKPLALVMFDIDRFKAVNDAFGHEEGDRVLAHVAEAARAVLRNEDAAFRYGGEEFVLLLRESDAEGGLRAAARLRADLAARPVTLGGAARVITFSAGVAAADEPNGFDTEGLVARADEALYRAKRGGRDRTELEAARIHAP